MRKYLFISIIAVIIIIATIAVIYVYSLFGNAKNIPVISYFFPESENKLFEENQNKNNNTEIIITKKENKETAEILKITDKPAVSYEISNNSLRYIDKLNGHLFQSDLNGENTEKISNTTILNIFDAVWGKNGESAIIKFLKDGININIYSSKFTSSSTIGEFLPINTVSASASTFENKIAYLADEKSKGIIFISNNDNSNKKQILSLPVNNFDVLWQNKENLILISKPSARVSGIFYSLNINSKNLKKIKEGMGIYGIMSLDGEKMFISESVNNSVKNKILNLKDKKEYEISLKTLPEKCIFSRLKKEVVFCAVPENMRGSFPDDWYKGKVVFKDTIYEINYITNENKIINEEFGKYNFDATNLKLSPDEKFLFTINKKESMLWRVKIKQDKIIN